MAEDESTQSTSRETMRKMICGASKLSLRRLPSPSSEASVMHRILIIFALLSVKYTPHSSS
jgi:hypothetical protein